LILIHSLLLKAPKGLATEIIPSTNESPTPGDTKAFQEKERS